MFCGFLTYVRNDKSGLTFGLCLGQAVWNDKVEADQKTVARYRISKLSWVQDNLEVIKVAVNRWIFQTFPE